MALVTTALVEISITHIAKCNGQFSVNSFSFPPNPVNAEELQNSNLSFLGDLVLCHEFK